MNRIKIAIGGDFCPIGKVAKGFRNHLLSRINLLDEVRDIVGEDDLIVLNLECPITESNTPIDKFGPNLKANKSAIHLLASIGTNLVSLANNHILDFGQKGLADTIELCSKYGIDTVGAGLVLEDARKIFYKRIKGRVLAVISAAEAEFASATPGSAGANPLEIISLLEDICEARKEADHILLILHGGLESVNIPSPKAVQMLRFLAEQGVTAIIRHHPHRVQGFEVWKGVPIFYSLGNFLFDWRTRVSAEGWYEGILVRLSINDDDRCSFEVFPFYQCKKDLGLRMLEGEAKEAFLARLGDYSEVIKSDQALKSEWETILKHRKSEYYGLLTMPSRIMLRVSRRLGLLRYARPPKRKRMLLENYLRCDAHREVLIGILERERS